MITVILVIHLFLAIALIGVVLLQRSEGGALGIGGGGGGGFGGMMTARGQANLLTRVTGGLALGFFLTSLGLALLANNTGSNRSIMDTPATGAPAAPQIPALPAAPQR
ncbi:MAG: preprotein translocase subunit SecG [Alphaproteobacteria bacterium]